MQTGCQPFKLHITYVTYPVDDGDFEDTIRDTTLQTRPRQSTSRSFYDNKQNITILTATLQFSRALVLVYEYWNPIWSHKKHTNNIVYIASVWGSKLYIINKIDECVYVCV